MVAVGAVEVEVEVQASSKAQRLFLFLFNCKKLHLSFGRVLNLNRKIRSSSTAREEMVGVEGKRDGGKKERRQGKKNHSKSHSSSPPAPPQ